MIVPPAIPNLRQLRSAKRNLRGFTLIELLTVIAIISILLTIGAIGIGSIGGGGVTSGVATSEAIFDEARSIAVSKRTNARVLISKQDISRTDTYLRRVVVAFQPLDPDGKPKTEWELASRGANLPEGVFFSQDLSRKNHASGGSAIDTMNLTGQSSDFNGEYYYYEFNGSGIATDPGASFVIGAGARQPTSSQPRTTGSNKNDFGGFVVWRNGSTSMFQSPEQIGIQGRLTNF